MIHDVVGLGDLGTWYATYYTLAVYLYHLLAGVQALPNYFNADPHLFPFLLNLVVVLPIAETHTFHL